MEEIDALGFIRRRENFTRYNLKEKYFSSSATREVFKILKKFFKNYPDKDVASKKNLKMEVDAEGDERKLLYEIIRSLPTKIDEDQGHTRMLEFVQQGIAKSILRENLDALEGEGKIDIGTLRKGLDEIDKSTPLEDTTYDYAEGVESFRRVYTGQASLIATGIPSLDESLPWVPTTGEEWIIVGPPGRGKTQTLLNLVFRAAEQGASCLYVTAGDQGRNRIEHRLNSIVSGIPWQRLEDPSVRAAGLLRKRVRENIISNGGSIKIQDWSDSSCCPQDIEALLNISSYTMLAVDYPDIMFSNPDSRYKERRHEIASIFRDLRRLAVKYGILVWCGSQANRSALDKVKVTMKDVAEDIQKCWVADGIITFCQTDDEKEDYIGRFFIAKARRPRVKEYEVNIMIDENTGRIE